MSIARSPFACRRIFQRLDLLTGLLALSIAALATANHLEESCELPANVGPETCYQVRLSSCQRPAWNASLACHSECPVIVQRTRFRCAYSCVSGPNCSRESPKHAFPDPETGLCEQCVPGCALCSSKDRCERCFSRFKLLDDGRTCVYELDQSFAFAAQVACSIVMLLLVVLGLWGSETRRSRVERSIIIRDPAKGDAIEDDTYHEEVLRLARNHHHWCKVRDFYSGGGQVGDCTLGDCEAACENFDSEEHEDMSGSSDETETINTGSGESAPRPSQTPTAEAEVKPPQRTSKSRASVLSGFGMFAIRGTDAGRAGYDLLSLCSNMHRRYVVGMGMPLYYNFMLFMLTFFTVCCLVHLIFVFSRSGDEYLHIIDKIYDTQNNATQCSSLSHDDTMASFMSSLAMERFREVLTLYFCGLILVSVFVCFQKHHAVQYISRNKTMRWHALSVRGFPPDATDEVELKDFFQTEFSKLLGRDVLLAHVSICYEMQHLQPGVDSLIDRLITIEDVRLGAYSHQFADTAAEAARIAESLREATGKDAALTGASREEWLRTAMQQFDCDVTRLFGGDNLPELRNSGEVFAVFEHAGDCAEVLNMLGKSERLKHFIVSSPSKSRVGGRQRRGFEEAERRNELVYAGGEADEAPREHLLEVFSCRNEPPCIGWSSYGLSTGQRLCRAVGSVLFILAFMSILFLLILWPSCDYILGYTSKMRDKPGGAGSMAFGVFVGTINWLICVFTASTSGWAGFLRSDRQEVIIFYCFTWMCVFNAMANIAVIVRVAYEDFPPGDFDWGTGATLEWERRVAYEILAMVCPGSFMPCLLWPLQGFVWPFLEGWLNLRLTKADKLTVRAAERRLEPLPLGLAWDYQGSFTIPFLGLAVTFFASDATPWMLFYLALWSLFFYCLQHFNHLRCAKIAYTTSNRLDTAVLYSWGLILGQLAASAAFWGVHAYKWPLVAVPVAFAVGAAMLWIVLWRVQPLNWTWDARQAVAATAVLDETRSRTLYDWANCNPVLVLKTQVVHLERAGLPRQMPFTVGKFHAWEVRRRWHMGSGEMARPTMRWYEPGYVYSKLGLIE